MSAVRQELPAPNEWGIQRAAFVIDEGIPIPPRKGRIPNHTPPEYPFEKMEVGDSFFSPGFSLAPKVAASEHAHLHPPMQFTSRAFDEDPVTRQPGVRIWRTR